MILDKTKVRKVYMYSDVRTISEPRQTEVCRGLSFSQCPGPACGYNWLLVFVFMNDSFRLVMMYTRFRHYLEC